MEFITTVRLTPDEKQTLRDAVDIINKLYDYDTEYNFMHRAVPCGYSYDDAIEVLAGILNEAE